MKYKDLTIGIQRTWDVTKKTIPVILGVIGTISKSLRQLPEQHTGKARNKELQTTAILDTAHRLREVLM